MGDAVQRKTQPEPVATSTVCSLCGLGWERHGDSPSAEDCIRLLRADLSATPSVPYYSGQPYWYQPYWYQPYWRVSTSYEFEA